MWQFYLILGSFDYLWVIQAAHTLHAHYQNDARKTHDKLSNDSKHYGYYLNSIFYFEEMDVYCSFVGRA